MDEDPPETPTSPSQPFATIKGIGGQKKGLQRSRPVTPPEAPDLPPPPPTDLKKSKVPTMQIRLSTGHPLRGILKKAKLEMETETEAEEPSAASSSTWDDLSRSSSIDSKSIRSVDSAYADTMVQQFMQYFMGLDIFLNLCTVIGVYPNNITNRPDDLCWALVRSNSGDALDIEPGVMEVVKTYNRRLSSPEFETRRDLRVPFASKMRNVNLYEIQNQLYLLAHSNEDDLPAGMHDPEYNFQDLVYPYRCIWESSIFAHNHDVRGLYFRDVLDLDNCLRKFHYPGVLEVNLRSILMAATRFTDEKIIEFMVLQRSISPHEIEPFFTKQPLCFTYNGLNRLYYLMVKWLQHIELPIQVRKGRPEQQTHSYGWFRRLCNIRPRNRDPRPEMNF